MAVAGVHPSIAQAETASLALVADRMDKKKPAVASNERGCWSYDHTSVPDALSIAESGTVRTAEDDSVTIRQFRGRTAADEIRDCRFDFGA